LKRFHHKIVLCSQNSPHSQSPSLPPTSTFPRNAVNVLARIQRGIVGRLQAKKAKESRKGRENIARFHYFAILTQKHFRGFYSRRYYHDFYARKKYISAIAEKGDSLRQELQQKREEQYYENQRVEEEKKRLEFHRISQNLHHLVSTKQNPGIYNSPYLAEPVGTYFNIY
jgi:hypothetical protein